MVNAAIPPMIAHHENLPPETIHPVWFCSRRRKARNPGRNKTRNGGEISPIALASSFEQLRLLAKDQTINEE